MADHYQDRKFHEASNGWQLFHDDGRGWSPPHGDRIARMQNFQERNTRLQYSNDRNAWVPNYQGKNARMQYHEERNARMPNCDDRNEEKQYQESRQMMQTGEEVVLQMSQIREDFRHMHENYRQMLCELDNMIEICRELEQEEAKDVQIQKIQGVIHQTAASFNEFSQKGVHNDEAKDMFPEIESIELQRVYPVLEHGDGGLDLSNEIQSIEFQKLHLALEKVESKKKKKNQELE